MKKISILLLAISLFILTNAFAVESTVTDSEELFTAFQDATIDTIKLGSDITISVEGYMTEELGIEVNAKDRTIDFNGYSINLDCDESIRVNYRTGNTLTFTNSSNIDLSGIFGLNEHRIESTLFELYNYSFDDVQLIFNGGYYSCYSEYILYDTNHFMLTINDGVFEYEYCLLNFDRSYASDFIINKAICSIIDGAEGSSNRLVYGKFNDDYIKAKLGEDTYLFEVDFEDNYTENSIEYCQSSFNCSRLEFLPESEAPEGAILSAIPNVLFENGILTWDAFEDENLDHYYFQISTGGGSINLDQGRTLSAPEKLALFDRPSGSYYLKLWAEDVSRNEISRKYLFKYEYEAPHPQLDTPLNIRWEDTYTASWDEVEDATGYDIYIYKDSTTGPFYFIKTVSTTSFDFSSDPRLSTDSTFYFKVYATSENNPSSDGSDYSEGKVGWFEKGNLSNVQLSSERNVNLGCLRRSRQLSFFYWTWWW